MNKIGKEMMTRDLLQFRFYTEEELVRMYMDALEVIDNLQSKIDKAIEYIDDLCKCSDGTYFNYGDDLSPKHIVDILKEDK